MTASGDIAGAAVFNKGATIVPYEAEGTICFLVDAPVPGAGLRRTHVTAAQMPDMHHFLTRVALAPTSGSITVAANEAKDLRASALLVEPDAVAAGKLEFEVPLPEVQDGSDLPTERLELGFGVTVVSTEEPAPSAPAEWAQVQRAPTKSLAWAEDPARGVAFPFWLTTDGAETVRLLIENPEAAADVEPDLRRSLLAAGVLVDPDERWPKRSQWTTSLARARDTLASRGYATLPQLLPPVVAEAVSRYYQAATKDGFLFPDNQGSFLYGHHNEPLAVWLHKHLSPLLGRVIPQPVKPSYAFVGVYGEGGELPAHTDRVQCEYTLSLAAGMHVDDAARPVEPWPLYLETADALVEARPRLGDAVLFKGREIPHFRPRLEGVRASVSVLCHFVPEDYDGPLD